MAGRGESIPRKENFCEIDPNVVDKYGIPVLKFNYKWSDEERKQAQHMHDTFEEVIHSMGGIALGQRPGRTPITAWKILAGLSMRWGRHVWVMIRKLP